MKIIIDRSVQNNIAIETEESEREREEVSSVIGDLQLQSPVQETPATGQANAQQFAALFPNDPTGALIAQRGARNV